MKSKGYIYFQEKYLEYRSYTSNMSQNHGKTKLRQFKLSNVCDHIFFLKNKDKRKQNIYAVKTSSTVYVRLSYEWGGNFDTIYSVKSYHETKLP